MASTSMQEMLITSYLSGNNAAYIEGLYEAYLQNPQSIPEIWRDCFDNLPQTNNGQEISHQAIQQYFLMQARSTPDNKRVERPIANSGVEKKQAHVLQLINSYRLYGHQRAKIDPLNLTEYPAVPALSLSYHQLSADDLDISFSSESSLTRNGAKLRDIVAALERTYADKLGIEYLHITDDTKIKWLQERIESVQSRPHFDAAKKQAILENLTAAEGLEKYLGARYVGQKRFSLEGGDSFIPLMHELVHRAGNTQVVKEVVIGMAHRGRLNVLVNVLGKKPSELFEEFEGKKSLNKMSGDVKYHQGFSADLPIANNNLHLVLAFNPSHLEIISPVVEGSVRARLTRRGDLVEKNTVLPIVVHGDAAFAGQGVVMETFNFSQARGYATGGTLHIVINNQIGFTTSNPLDLRSTLYCTDIAKMVQAPILHVNGDDPEMVVFAAQLAFDYRMRFHSDIVIDLVCYRRHGHNEADEPTTTQPKMYEVIKRLPTVRSLYAKRLIEEQVITEEKAAALVSTYRDKLDRGEAIVPVNSNLQQDGYIVDWSPFLNKNWREPFNTSISVAKLEALGEKLSYLPTGFALHPIVKKVLQDRQKMIAGEIPFDWGGAEILAYATLLDAGYPIRLSGQDSGRGTFAHRHMVLHDVQTAKTYVPLSQIAKCPEDLTVIDSVLSEEAVLAFEYGFAAAAPDVLTIWEAQFGDFANGAQVVIDQFISSGEQKWGRLCGLIMYLPHGQEGQGPEHSSARLERYMQLCAQHNMQVCVPTTPAQMFHLIRRQLLRPFRKPLIVMTPKSLLRHKLVTSSLSDLSEGEFHLIIPEVDALPPKKVSRVILCSGKVYYDLLEERRKRNNTTIAIIRIEQLYPFPKEELKAELLKYPNAKDVVWCQEEPKNQGAWFASQHNMIEALASDQTLRYVGRPFFAAPAAGYLGLHLAEQRQLVEEALAL